MNQFFSHFAKVIADAVGSWQAFAAAVLVVLIWGVSGFYYGFSNQLYQLVINTGTTIVTFLMVFLLQATQARDTLAIEAKLDALIKSSTAPNKLMHLERQTDEEIRRIQDEM